MGRCIIASPAPLHYMGSPSMNGKTPEEMQSRMEEMIRNPPKADPEFVKKAVVALPGFCMYLESRLHLEARTPMQFDPQSLTRDGLRSFKSESEDFVEQGR